MHPPPSSARAGGPQAVAHRQVLQPAAGRDLGQELQRVVVQVQDSAQRRGPLQAGEWAQVAWGAGAAACLGAGGQQL